MRSISSGQHRNRTCRQWFRLLLAAAVCFFLPGTPVLAAVSPDGGTSDLLGGFFTPVQLSLVLASLALLALLAGRELVWKKRCQLEQGALKQAEEALDKSELKYRELFNGTSDAIFIHEAATMRVIDVNQQAVELLGYSREEFCQMPVGAISEGIPPYYNGMAVARGQLLESGGPQVFEWRARRKDGRLIWVEVALRSIELEGSRRVLAIVRDVDEQVSSREALNKSEEMYRALFENAGSAYMFVEADNTISLVNLEMERTLGLSRGEIEGRLKWTEFVASPDDLTRMQEYHRLRRSQPGLAPNVYETRIKDCKGRVFEALITAVIIPGTAKTLASITDISQLRSAERARQSSEVMYRAIFENTGNASIIIAPDTTIQLANSEWLNLSGHSREETEGIISWTRYIHPDDLERMKKYHYDRRQDLQAPRKYEFRFIRSNGEMRYISNNVTMIPGTDLSIASLMDISELKHTEAERIRLQNLLANIINSMPSMLVGIDKQRRINQWNVQAEKHTWMDRASALGRNVFEVLPFLASKEKLVEQTLSGGGINKVEKMLIFHQGRTMYADITIYPLEDVEPCGGVIRIDDITEKVRLENIMIQTEKMMSVGGLAAGMAHEINNPLGGIIQGAQNIHRRLDPLLEQNLEAARECGLEISAMNDYLERRQVLEFLEGIRRSRIRAARIVNNMLQFSRTGESEHSRCDLARLLDGAVELASNDYDLKKKYDFRHIAIDRHYDSRVPPVNCAETEIEQVLLNLLKNAAQAMMGGATPRSHPAIALRIYSEGEMAVIEVEDNGPGMEESVAKRVFEPFFTTKAPGEGTGLGLSVSYFIITENHRGQIYVESQPGRGARFVIKLPVKGKAGNDNG